MQAHEVDCEIIGDDLQLVEIELDPTGRVRMQSMPFSRLANRVLANAPAAGGARTEEGSILGGLGGLLDGD
jgi:uncharacterized protein (AIM24 family)